MRIPKLTQNSYLLFAPFLIIFIVFVIVFRGRITEGDQMGYLFFANNLLHGFYSPPAPDINLWWGPGYPILLMPFVFFKVPQAGILILNAVLQYLSIVFLFKALVKMIPFSKAMIFSLFWALCYSSYNYMASIVTESLTVFLLSLLIYSLVMTFTRNSNKFMVLSGFILGYLALTKVIFGYVILVMLLFYVLMWIIQKQHHNPAEV
ncbi:MAG: glycosyltransferase family 39 protein [Bacteroidales bacterium]|nr:glycosyltransferase family 39 protein [Bacteroidales bacterium]